MRHAENSNCKPALCDEIDPKRTEEPDPKLLQSIARAHHWASALANNTYKSIDDLAAKATLHPKVARNKLRLVFLSPEITEAILTGRRTFGLADLRKLSSSSWRKST